MLVYTKQKVPLLLVPGKILEHHTHTILVVDSISQCDSSITVLVHSWSVVTVGLYPLSRSQDLLILGVPQTNAEGEEKREGEEKAYCDQI